MKFPCTCIHTEFIISSQHTPHTRTSLPTTLRPWFAFLHHSRGRGEYLQHGVEVEITENALQHGGRHHIEVRALRRFEIVGSTWLCDHYTMANIKWMPPSSRTEAGAWPDEAQAAVGEGGVHGEGGLPEVLELAAALEPLVEQWQALVVAGGWERYSGQLARSLQDIGEMPPALDAAGAVQRALWVGSLINPLPGLGVAPEIRPLLVSTTDDRTLLLYATQGIQQSIHFLSPSPAAVWLARSINAIASLLGRATPAQAEQGGQAPMVPRWISLAVCVGKIGLVMVFVLLSQRGAGGGGGGAAGGGGAGPWPWQSPAASNADATAMRPVVTDEL